jgi:hypothetical protein
MYILVGGANTFDEALYVKPVTTDAGDCCCPFPIPRLNLLAFAMSIRACNNHHTANHAHHEARLIEVVEIAVRDAVLAPHVEY